MHWIQTIREHLELSQDELAFYLGLSVHTINSVEYDRRQLPLARLQPALDLFNTVMDSLKQDPTEDPLLKQEQAVHSLKRLRHQCCYKLERLTDQLRQMQKAYTGACRRLFVYRSMLQSLASADGKENPDRLKWIQFKIEVTVHQIRANDGMQQRWMEARIVGLRGMIGVLERDASVSLDTIYHREQEDPGAGSTEPGIVA